MLSASIQGVGMLGPGLVDWPSSAAILRGDAPYVPARTVLGPPAALPPAERRRAGRLVRLALAVGAEAVHAAQADAGTLASVFTSSGGDGDTCHEICATLAGTERAISPTRFHNSVHNAAAGYWGIAYGCREPSTALCAHDASFGAGLLEALCQLAGGAGTVLLVAYDVDYPPPMRAHRAIPDALGVALLLADAARGGAARLRVTLTGAAAQPLADPALDVLRRAIPAARALPLLAHLATGGTGSVVLDYLDTQRLCVQIDP